MAGPRVVMFVNEERGHLQRVLPLMTGLRRRGVRVDVLTHSCHRADLERTGARFLDLFDGCPPEAADPASRPAACRAVAFAGRYAEAVAARLERDPPALIVHDTFAVIGHVVGRLMGVPYVNVCAGHDVQPGPFVATLQTDPRVLVSPECHAMVARLRERHGIADASPFFYVAAFSPLLNLYCEPPEYLPDHSRRTFEPLAFFG